MEIEYNNANKQPILNKDLDFDLNEQQLSAIRRIWRYEEKHKIIRTETIKAKKKIEENDYCKEGDVDLYFNLRLQKMMQNISKFQKVNDVENDFLFCNAVQDFDKKEFDFCKKV